MSTLRDTRVRLYIVPALAGHGQAESRTITGEIDRTAPPHGYPAPGPAINVWPRGKRGLRGWLRRRGKR